MLSVTVLLATVAGAWYLLIVRPQRDQQTRHGQLVEQLRVGDHVLTVGGIYGRVQTLEGASMVLELAPGMTTRISTDAVARIAHDHEAPMPTTNTTDTDMPHDPTSEPHHVPAGVTTVRARIEPVFDTWEPRPWSAVAPINAPQLAHTPAHAFARPMQTQATFQPVQLQQPFAEATGPLMPAMPLHAPFAPEPRPAAPAAAQPQRVVAQHPERRHSRAPKGMGSTLRLDDPSIRDVMQRARQERAQLADEYAKLTAPLVQLNDPAPIQVRTVQDPQLAALPRPRVVVPDGAVDPAFASAFQRRAPYARAHAHA